MRSGIPDEGFWPRGRGGASYISQYQLILDARCVFVLIMLWWFQRFYYTQSVFLFFAFSTFLDGWSSISAVYIYGILRITTEEFDLQLWISINPCRSNTDHCRNNIKRNLSEYFFSPSCFWHHVWTVAGKYAPGVLQHDLDAIKGFLSAEMKSLQEAELDLETELAVCWLVCICFNTQWPREITKVAGFSPFTGNTPEGGSTHSVCL